MDSINFNFNIKTKRLNSDNTKDIKQEQDISNNNNIQSEYAKINPNLLPIYKNVSFKGQKVEAVKPEFRSRYLNSFKQFNDAKKAKILRICETDITAYYKYRDIIDSLLKEQALPSLSFCHT